MQKPAFPQPMKMTDDIWQIDLMEQGLRYRTGAYVILDEKPTLIETGSANSHEALMAGLSAIGLSAHDLAYVVVTHVHLDHAGGAGQLIAKAPQAQLVVHPRGARHMADPSKLWAGATQVYGDKTEALFGGVVPVPTEHILVREHEETLSIGRRTLQFFDSPGHAKHHFTILSEVDRALFAGDAVGIRYPTEFTGFPFEFIAPSSSPIDFDPAAVHQTLDMLLTLPFDWVYHAHFGKSLKLEAIDHTRRLADAFAAVIERIYSPDIETQTVVAELRRLIADDLERQGKTALDLRVLDIDVVLDALGLVYYEKKRRERNN